MLRAGLDTCYATDYPTRLTLMLLPVLVEAEPSSLLRRISACPSTPPQPKEHS